MTMLQLLWRPFVWLALLGAIAASAAPGPVPPNVVLILVDDYGYGDISFEGNTQMATPHIDRLAEEGTRFTRFYQSAGACAPTRAALLTGRDFFETGVWGVHWGRDFIHRDEHTLGNLLGEAGYRTGVFGKWHSGKTSAYFGWNRGFETSVHTRLYEYFDTRVLADNRLVHVAGPMTDVVGEQAVAFIREHRREPFFCYVPFQAIHEPFNAPEAEFSKYKALGYSDHVARLYGMIEVLDDNVGRILHCLDELNLTDQTLVLFLVDDGASPGFDLTYQTRRMNPEERAERERAWGRRLRGTKASIGEGGQISPFYARWPGTIPAGRSVDLLSGVLDIYPTLAELCQAPFPRDQLPLRGRSLAPTLLGGEQDFDDRIYFDGTNLYQIEREAAEVDGRPRIRWLSAHYREFKYIREDRWLLDGTDTVRHRLYNLKEDPAEKHDIAEDHPDVTGFLRRETEAWFDRMLQGGRAFQEATYVVGDWSERGTPINLDSAFAFEGVSRAPSNAFTFTGWDSPGDTIRYHVDVLESGLYEVELNYRLKGAPTGARFAIRLGETEATAQIEHPRQSTSTAVRWPAGSAPLQIELTDLNGSEVAFDRLDLLVVRRLPAGERGIVEDAEMVLELPEGEPIVARRRDEAREFMAETPARVHAVPLGDLLKVRLAAKNPEAIKRWRLFLGFEEIAASSDASAPLWIRLLEPGRVTLNASWTDVHGHENSARLECRVESSVPDRDD